MTEIDTYKTILSNTPPVLFKDKNSKFYGYAFPVGDEEHVKEHLKNIKKEHHKARHWCYAYQLGTEQKTFRANDDGEPNNSAGLPIYGQIQSYDVTNILIIVVRYFGGVKLGVGGLIQAYKNTAQLTLESSSIIQKEITTKFKIEFDYKDMNKVMRLIKENHLKISHQNLEMSCKIIISVRKKDAAYIFEIFDNTFGISIKK